MEKEKRTRITYRPSGIGNGIGGDFEIKSNPFYDCESIKDPIYLFI